MPKIVYSINPTTKEYSGKYTCQESPLEPGVFLIPQNCVEQEPPACPDGYAMIWTGALWVAKPDYRKKKVYSQETGVFVVNPNVDTYRDFWFSLPDSYAIISDEEESKILSELYDVSVISNKVKLTPKKATEKDKLQKQQDLSRSCKLFIAQKFGAQDIQEYNLMLTLGEISLTTTNDFAETPEMNEKWFYYKKQIEESQTLLDLSKIKFVWE